MTYNKSLPQNIYISYKYLNNLVIKYLFLLSIVGAIIVVCTDFWALNRGLIFSDEAWYFLHLKNLPYLSISYWPAYTKIFFPAEHLTIKYFTFSINILTGIFLSMAIGKYYKQSSFLKLLPVTLIALMVFRAPVLICPNYVFYSKLLFYSGISCYFYMLSVESLFTRYFWGLLTGFLFGQLFFIMITNMPYILVLFASVFLLKAHRKYSVQYCLAMSIGLLFAGVYFFTAIRPFDLFIYDFKLALVYLSFDKTHGIQPILKWSIETILYFITEIIVPAFLLYFIIVKEKSPVLNRYLAIIAFIIYACTLIFLNFYYDQLNITSASLIYIMLVFLILALIKRRAWSDLTIVLMLSLIPFCGSMGTNVKFSVRSVGYLAPIIVVLSIYLKNEKFSKLSLIFYSFLFLALVRYCMVFMFTPGWAGYVINDQRVKLSTIGIDVNIQLDSHKIEEVKELKKLIPTHSMVLINNTCYWGYVYLLDLNVPYYYFDFNESHYNYYISKRTKKLKQVYLLEQKDNPFPVSLKSNISINKTDTIPLKVIKNMNLFKITYL